MTTRVLTIAADNTVRVVEIDHFTDKVARDMTGGAATFHERVLAPRATEPDRDFVLFYSGLWRKKRLLASVLHPAGPRPLLVVAVGPDGTAFTMTTPEMIWVCTQLVAAESGITLPKELTA